MLLLIDPPFHAFFEYDRWWFSYSCAQLAAATRRQGIETWIYDADRYFPKDPCTRNRTEMVRRQPRFQQGIRNDDHPIWRHFHQTLEKIRPDVVGITAWTPKHPATLKILQMVKAFDPSIKTCIGGYHATALPSLFIQNPCVDAVIAGPADHALPQWIQAGYPSGIITASPESVNIRDLPVPAREALLFPEHFTPDDMGMITTSRGCPQNCSFCSNRMMTGRGYQRRSTEQIREEIEHILAAYPIRHLNVADADFLADHDKALETAAIIHDFGLTWGCEGHISTVHEPFIRTLMERGLQTLAFGVETGTDRGFKVLRKGITKAQVRQASQILNGLDITWKAFFIAGFPHETLADIRQTRDFALEIAPSALSLNAFVPLPGTQSGAPWLARYQNPEDSLYFSNQLNPAESFMTGVSNEEFRTTFTDTLERFDRYNQEHGALQAFHEKRYA